MEATSRYVENLYHELEQRAFALHLVAGLSAYCHQPKKPSLGLRPLALPWPQLIPNSR